MKSRNLAKIVTLILSCALLIGAVVGISVVANESEGTTVAIKGANIAYEGAVQVVYYVDAQNLADGDVVKLVITNAEGEEITSKTNYVDYVKGDVTYKAFFSDGIAPKNLRQNVYAKAIVVDSEGAVKAATEVVAYSPYTYAMNRFGQSATPAQTELYKALLNYGAAVQAVLDPETAGTPENPWADEYWNVTIDGTEYIRGNLFDGTYTADRFNAEGESFTGWTDAEGATVVGWTTMTFKPGVATVLNSNYAEPHADLITFDGETLPGSFTSTAGLANQLPAADYTGGYYYHNTAEGYLEVGRQNAQTNGSQFKFAPATPGVYAREYVFETDFMVKDWNMTLGGWTLKFDLWAAGSGNNAEIANSTLNGASAGEQFRLGGITADVGTWHHIKFVASIADDGTVTTTFYVDGKASDAGVQKALQNGDYKMLFAGIQFRDGGSSEQNASDASYCLDNTVCYVTGDPVSYELDLDANGGTTDPYTVTMGEAYTLPTPVNGNLPFVGWYIGETLVEQTGTWNYVLYDSASKTYGKTPTLVAKWATPVNVTLDPNGGSVSSTSASVYTGQAYTLPTPERAGLVFGGWYDAEGNMYAAKGTWIGETDVTLTAKWYTVVSETFNDYDDGTASNVNFNNNVPTFANGAMTLPITKTYIGNIFNLPASLTGVAAGSKYIYETDFTYNGITASTVSSADGMGWVGFLTTAGNSNGNMIQAHMMKYGTDDNGDGIIDYISVFGQKYYVGEKVTLRIEYVVGENVSHLYHDGVYIGTTALNGGNDYTTKNDVTTVSGFSWHFRSTARFGDVSFTFDNTLVQVLPEAKESNFTLDAGYGTLPENAQTEWTLATGESYTLPTPTIDGFKFAGWSCGDTAIATSGKWAAALAENAVLTANWKIESAHSTDFSDGTLPSWITGGGITVADGKLNVAYSSSGIQFKPVETVVGAAAGTKYIFEMDFTFNNVDTATDNNLAFIGFSHTTATWESGTHKWSYLGASNTADAVYMYGNKFAKGETVTVRFEFVVTGANTGDLTVYMNDSTGANTVGGTKTGLNTGDFYQFNIQWRGAAASRNLSATIDNVTVAVEYPVVEGTVTLDPNGGILPEDAEDSYTLMNGMKLPELPTPNGGAYAFAGWYNGSTLIKGGDTWLGGTATLVAKYLDTTVTTCADATITKNTTWTRTSDTTALNAGDKVVFSTTYIYRGLTGVTLTDGVISDNSGSDANRNFGFPRFYDGSTGVFGGSGTVKVSGNYVNAEGVVVADAEGKLLEGYTDLTADQIFYQYLTWDSMTFEIGKEYTIVYTFTINGNGSITAAPVATDADGNVDTGAAVKWNNGNNITKFTFEYRGTSYVGAYTNTQEFKNTKFELIKPLDGTIAVDDTKADASGNKKDPAITVPNYSVNNVDVAGQVFTIQTKYTFLGLGGVFTIDPETFQVTDCYVDNATIAYMGFYNNNSIGDRLKYASAKLPSTAQIVNAEGEVVVDENNVLLEEYRDLTADDLFYSQVTWAGITFDIGVEYDLFMSYTTGATTYANGVVTAAVGTTKITATANGVTKTGAINDGPSNDCDFLHNIQGFSFYCRGNSYMTGSADIAYTFYHSFKDIVTTIYTPDVDLGIADDATIYGVALHKYDNTSSVKYVSVVAGVAYTLADPAAIDGYTFEGWYVCDTKGVITGEEAIPSTGDAWPFSANVRLAAKWVAVEAGE